MQCLASLTRRALLVLATTLLLACSVPAGAGPLVDAVDSITIAVSALERSLPLYEDVLSSEWVSDVEAITNATFAATGKRVRKLPVEPQR